MSTYHVSGQVATISLRVDDSTWQGSVLIPSFLVQAGSRTEARGLAEEIVDPLKMAPMSNIDVTEAPYALADTAQFSAELARTVEALNDGDAGTEHAALRSMAGQVAALLGFDLRDLLDKEEKG